MPSVRVAVIRSFAIAIVAIDIVLDIAIDAAVLCIIVRDGIKKVHPLHLTCN